MAAAAVLHSWAAPARHELSWVSAKSEHARSEEDTRIRLRQIALAWVALRKSHDASHRPGIQWV